MNLNMEDVKALVPRSHKANITPEFVDLINSCTNGDTELANNFKENFVSFSSVLQSGKYKMTDYLNAVQYVTYKMLGKSNIESWKLTFPDRVDRLIKSGVKDMSPYASMYNSNKLVTQITQQTIVPLYVLNGNMAQEALNTLYDVMKNTGSDKVRVEACKAVLDAVKQPEQHALDISVEVKADNIIEGMRDVINDLASKQASAVRKGTMTTKEIFEANIIDIETV